LSLIPNYLLRRLYQRDSLRNVHGGVSFCLKNRLSEATITAINSVEVDGENIPLSNVSFLPTDGGAMVAATDIVPERGLFLPIGGTLQVRLEMETLADGEHHLELGFQCRPFGNLKVRIDSGLSQQEPEGPRIPRDPVDNYSEDAVTERRAFLKNHCSQSFENVFKDSYDPHLTRGNIENFVGTAQIPIGLAGPLLLDGEHAQGEFYIPMATTEGTLVASYNRGMKLTRLSGGIKVTVVGDNMQRAPVFVFEDARGARRFVDWVVSHLDDIRRIAQSTSSVAKLKYIDYYLSNKFAYLRFNFTTGDAAGQNMVGKATMAACDWILERYKDDKITRFFLESNFATDKKASMINVMRSRGKRVTAEITIPRQVMSDVMGVDTKILAYHNGVANVGSWLAGANNNGLHSANAITAVFIATGQDVANVAESSAAILYTELTEESDLYFSITLPSLIVATYGGGTGLPTQRECLEMLDCWGEGKVFKLAEIVAGTVLAGELSLACAISSLEWVSSHEELGRNR
jgi:hydroxymethylglutaryl-CoA reductase (NADPH)